MRERQAAYNDKHLARAIDCIATERCSTDLTDGFCGPRDGCCHRHGARDCVAQARSALAGLVSRGLMVVWVYDKDLPPEVRSHLQRVFEERHNG